MPVRRLGAGHDSGETEWDFHFIGCRELNNSDTRNWFHDVNETKVQEIVQY
jgi:hypothetical protein